MRRNAKDWAILIFVAAYCLVAIGSSLFHRFTQGGQ